MKDSALELNQVHELVQARAYDRAIDLANQLIERGGESAAVLRARSGALACAGRFHEAREDAARCLEMEPHNLDYAIHSASLAIESGRPHEAVHLLQARIAPNGDGTLERVLSGAWAACGEYRRALQHAEAAVAKRPGHDEFLAHAEGLSAHVERQIQVNLSMESASAPPRRPPTGPFKAQLRVLHALILREIAGQYERSRLGYLWAIIEPIVHLMVLGFFFSLLNHSTAPLGHNLYLFYLTGLLPFFMVIHTGSKVMQGLSANRSLLLLPPIKVFDVLVARGILSLLTELLVAALILVIFNLVGIEAVPEDGLSILGAMLLAWFFGVSLGIFMAMLNEMFESWEMIWSQITRVLYFCSGIFYIAEKMPPEIRAVLIWNPVLQCIELLRAGFYSGFQPPWLEPGYLLLLSTLLLAGGLILMRVLDRHIGVES
ncbi:ABC transporter permease [Cupriavidus sp. BIC8F]|uniref:ABC transporter permease n=1 Tax=Cupriavidus sp. BIC8F TaxID=3079014 RepID=UPI0029162D42|nr:ABC transporter permease [Cupriavidus sp. BIC8F]